MTSTLDNSALPLLEWRLFAAPLVSFKSGDKYLQELNDSGVTARGTIIAGFNLLAGPPVACYPRRNDTRAPSARVTKAFIPRTARFACVIIESEVVWRLLNETQRFPQDFGRVALQFAVCRTRSSFASGPRSSATDYDVQTQLHRKWHNKRAK